MHRLLGVALGVLVGAGSLPAADPAPAEKTGPKVGEKAPEFKLKDQAGKEQSLSALLKGGPVAVVFHRSAGW